MAARTKNVQQATVNTAPFYLQVLPAEPASSLADTMMSRLQQTERCSQKNLQRLVFSCKRTIQILLKLCKTYVILLSYRFNIDSK